MSDLRDYMITIDTWSLELVQVEAENSFTTYLGLEMRLIIHKFTQQSKGKVEIPNKFPMNLYRDEYVCACIQNFLLSQQQASIENAIKTELGKDYAT